MKTLLCAITVLFAAGIASAQAFPSKPIKIVVGGTAGGTSDVTARIIADRMKIELNQPVVVDNKPGAGGAIGAEFVAHAPADGYTLIWGGSSMTMVPSIQRVGYDPVKDFAPISRVMEIESFLIVRADVPVRTTQEFVAYLKSNSGKVNYGSVGTGSVSHFQGEQFKAITGTGMLHVPYKGSGPALTDMMGGQLQVIFDSWATSGPFIESGKVRALAAVSSRRSPKLPDVPTLEEVGVKGLSAIPWAGLMAPAGTPSRIIDQLNAAVVATLRDPEVQERLRKIAVIGESSTPEAMGTQVRNETARWAELAKTMGIKAE